MVDILLLVSGIICMLAGLLGCLLPVLPGPPLSFAGLFLLHLSKYTDFSIKFLVVWAAITIVVTVLDYIVPVWGARKFGGSRSGTWGAAIGMVAGLFIFPPVGLILLPFMGAFIGELLEGKETALAFRAALGTFIGFLLGTGLKLAASLMMTFYFVRAFFI
ncbi:MAG: DUF456 domain-containing protein [Bacteroidales bacterium]